MISLPAPLVDFWQQAQQPIMWAVLAIVAALLAWTAWKFWRSRHQSRTLVTVAAVVAMAWTSEGVLGTVLHTFHVSLEFAGVSFFVFELMALAAAKKADETRIAKGYPGPAGAYTFYIASLQGLIASFGAASLGEVVFRILLPPSVVGLWWLFLTAERDTDTPEMLAERARKRAEREATWVHTPRTVAVKLGLMKPGTSSVTEAQREFQIGRMVVAADRIAAGGRGVDRARRKLRKLARTSTPEMIAAVAVRVRQAVEAEALMVPASASPPANGADSVAEILPDRQAGSEPPEDPTQEPPAGPTGGRQDPASGTAKDTATRTARKPARKPAAEPASDAAKKVAHWAAKLPDATNVELAAKAKVSTRTVERHRPPRETASVDPGRVNGSQPEFANQ